MSYACPMRPIRHVLYSTAPQHTHARPRQEAQARNRSKRETTAVIVESRKKRRKRRRRRRRNRGRRVSFFLLLFFFLPLRPGMKRWKSGTQTKNVVFHRIGRPTAWRTERKEKTGRLSVCVCVCVTAWDISQWTFIPNNLINHARAVEKKSLSLLTATTTAAAEEYKKREATAKVLRHIHRHL